MFVFMNVSLELFFNIFFIVSFKFSIELYRFPRAHRKIELYLPTWGWEGVYCNINKDNGSHGAHKQRQTGQEGGEGRSVRDRGGDRGQDAMGCALLGLNEEKQLSRTPPPILEIKKDK